MKILLLFLFYFLNCVIIVSQELTPPEIFEKCNNSVVLVIVEFQETKSTNLASGVVVDDLGIVITNYHILGKEFSLKEIEIKHRDDTLKDVKIIGSDKENDILILKIPDYKYPPIIWAENQNNKVGEKIYAIGSPFGLENSFSDGIINALDRNVEGIGNNLIQFSSITYHGSSGGALLNNRGELIGITVGGKSDNICFAIPISLIQETYHKSNLFLVQQKLDVLNNDYWNKINIYVDELSDTINLREAGKHAYKKGDYADVIFYYTLFLQNNSGSDSLYYQRGRALLAFNYDSLAELDFLKCIEINPKRVDIIWELGWYYDSRYIIHYLNPSETYFSKYDTTYLLKALYYHNLSIKTNPDFFAPYENLVIIYFNVFKNIDSCIEIISKAINRKKYIGYWYWKRSNFYNMKGDEKNQLLDLNNAIKYRNNDSLLGNFPYPWPEFKTMYFTYYFIARGKIYYSKKQYEKAINDFTSIIKIENEPTVMGGYWSRPEATYLRSLSFYYLEKYEEALNDMEWLNEKSMYKNELEPKIKKIKEILGKK